MELEGQVALITGGTRGIGRGIAEAFVAEGANVVINGRSADKGAQAIEEMDAGDQVHFIAGDVTDREICEGLVDQTVEHYGKIDIVVPNAGGGTKEGEEPSPLVDLTDANWEFVLDWNLNHPMWVMRRALKYMIPQGSGRIMSVSSMYESCHSCPSTILHDKTCTQRSNESSGTGSTNTWDHCKRVMPRRHSDRRHASVRANGS